MRALRISLARSSSSHSRASSNGLTLSGRSALAAPGRSGRGSASTNATIRSRASAR